MMTSDHFQNEQHTTSKTIWLTLLVITIVGAILRVGWLDLHSLSNDELSSWERSNHETFAAILESGVERDVHPPGYHLVVYGIIRFFDDSIWMLRLPSALAGVLTIPAIFLVGRRMLNAPTGLFAAALFAGLWAPVFYAQTGRMYSLMMLLSVLCMHLWWRMLTDAEQRRNAPAWVGVAFALTAACLSYMHYFGMLLAGMMCAAACFNWLFRRRRQWLIVASCLLTAALLLPWLAGLSTHLQRPPTHLDGPHLLFFGEFMFYVFGKSIPLSMIASIALLTVFVGFMTRVWPRDKRWVLLALSAIVVLPYAVVHLKSVVSQPVLKPRYLLMSAPAAYLLVGYVLHCVPLFRRRFCLAALVMVVVTTAQLVFVNRYYTTPAKVQFREAAACMIDQFDAYPAAPIIACSWDKQPFNYFLQQAGVGQRVDVIACGVTELDDIDAMLEAKAPTHFWFLRGHRPLDDELLVALKVRGDVVEHASFFRADTFLFEVK